MKKSREEQSKENSHSKKGMLFCCSGTAVPEFMNSIPEQRKAVPGCCMQQHAEKTGVLRYNKQKVREKKKPYK